MVERGLAESRQKAQAVIMAGAGGGDGEKGGGGGQIVRSRPLTPGIPGTTPLWTVRTRTDCTPKATRIVPFQKRRLAKV